MAAMASLSSGNSPVALSAALSVGKKQEGRKDGGGGREGERLGFGLVGALVLAL